MYRVNSDKKINQIKSLLIKYGYKLLSDTYKDRYTVITFKDKLGYKYTANWIRIKNRQFPKMITKYNKFSIYNIKLYIKLNDIPCVLLSEQFQNVNSYLKFVCDCGTEYKAQWSYWYKNNKYQCNKCSNQNARDKEKLNIVDLKQIFSKRGYILLDDTYINSSEKLTYVDKDGFKFCNSLSTFKQIKEMAKFSAYNPYTVKNLELFMQLNNFKSKLIECDYKNISSKIRLECECGEQYVVNVRTVIRLVNDRCPRCTHRQSNIEFKIKQYLIKNNIEYESQYAICSPFSNKKLFFDFYMQNYIIEVDGEQHYKYVKLWHKTEDGFILQQKKDEYKNNYCKDNNIPLLRIPYWEFKNDNYKKIIDDFLAVL